jgi:hypothetical protein
MIDYYLCGAAAAKSNFFEMHKLFEQFPLGT